MRLLIGLYLAVGAAMAALAVAIGFLGVRSFAVGKPGARQGSSDEEAVVIAAILLITALIPLFIGYGLWKRWRLVRIGLIVLSCWTALVSVSASGAALAILAGLTTAQDVGIDEPPGVTFATAAALLAFSAWQVWVLTRPAVRTSFVTTSVGNDGALRRSSPRSGVRP